MKLRQFIAVSILVLAGAAHAQDMTVYGIAIGEPFNIQECPWGYGVDEDLARQGRKPPERCYDRFSDRGAFYGDAPAPTNGDLLVKWISLDRMYTQPSVWVTLIDGNVEAVVFPTSGVRNAQDVVTVLTEKYGKPTAHHTRRVTTLMAASLIVPSADWDLPRLRVTFDGCDDSDITTGTVKIASRKAVEKEKRNKAERDAKAIKL
jgi:hypothetical protein